MNFDDKLREMINQAEVPDELMPENIAAMLKSRSSQSNAQTEKKSVKTRIVMSSSMKKQAVIVRLTAACAACIALCVGIFAFTDTNDSPGKIDAPVNYEAVTPDNYDDLLKFYKGIYFKDSGNTEIQSDGNADGSATESENNNIAQEPIEPVKAEPDEPVNGDADQLIEGASKADIIKNDNTHLYYITDSGVYIVSLDSLEVVSHIQKGETTPFEMFIEGNKLILISKEIHRDNSFAADTENYNGTSENKATDTIQAAPVPADAADLTQQSDLDHNSNHHSDINADKTDTNAVDANGPADSATAQGPKNVDRTNIVVEEYDISDKANPILITKYKQNGDYTSAYMVDGDLYLVTVYSDYRIKPLEKEADLDSFVPAYFINGEKYYVAAGDITIPANAGTTDYTVISRTDFTAESFTTSVKAVLGTSKTVYCSADTLYVVGADENDTAKSTITSFDISNGQLTSTASVSVDGTATKWMSNYSKMLRIVVKAQDESGFPCIRLYVLNDKLEVVNTSDTILSGQNVTSVKFNENYVSFMVDGENTPVATIDLSVNPPVPVEALEGSASSVITAYGENKLLSFGIEYENGKQTGACLSMFDGESGQKLHSTVLDTNSAEIFSMAFSDKRAVLADYDRGIIAVPVYSYNEFGTKNQYFIYSYDDSVGFSVKGVIEYNDIDDSYIFERAAIVDDVFYAISKGRIVSAQVSDFKVIDSFTF